MEIDVKTLIGLTNSRSYWELALRADEYLDYCGNCYACLDEQILAEACWFNCLLSFLVALGMPREHAEQFCEQDDNLVELALRIRSIAGPITLTYP